MHRVAQALLCMMLVASPVRAQPTSCAGDCDGDGSVEIYELVRLVNAALSVSCLISEPEFCPRADPCFAADANGDGVIEANELIVAVNRIVEAIGNGLYGCR